MFDFETVKDIKNDMIIALIILLLPLLLYFLQGDIVKSENNLEDTLNQIEIKIEEANKLPNNGQNALNKLVKNHKQIYYIKNEVVYYNQNIDKKKANYIATVIYLEAIAHDIDPYLLTAIGVTESGLNHSEISRVGAIGMFQMMPSTAEIYNINPVIFEENVKGGAKYISDLIDAYGEIRLALGHYNGGSNPSWKIKNYPETKNYVWKVTFIYNALKERY